VLEPHIYTSEVVVYIDDRQDDEIEEGTIDETDEMNWVATIRESEILEITLALLKHQMHYHPPTTFINAVKELIEDA
jgi:hypothetical protein